MCTGKLRREAFQFDLTMARHVFRGRSAGLIAPLVPVHRRFKIPVRANKKLRTNSPLEMTQVRKILTARGREKSFSKTANNIHVSRAGPGKIVRGGAVDSKSGIQEGRTLPGKGFENSTWPDSVQPIKLISGSVSSLVYRKNASPFLKPFIAAFEPLRPQENEPKGLVRSAVIGTVKSTVSYGRKKNISGFQENDFIHFVGQRHTAIQSANNKSQDSTVPSGPLRKKLLENLTRDQSGQHRIVKEDFSPDDWGIFPSKSPVGIFERHDPERSSRLSARQGHGGVDELRFPQYPGRSIGIS